MNSVLYRASRNFLWRHPWQLALAILGVALGVAVVIAIDLALESSLSAFERSTKAFSGAANYKIIASEGGLDEKLYRRLRVEEGLTHLSPVVNGSVRLSNQGGDVFKLIGIDPFIEKSFESVWQMRENAGHTKDWLARLMTEPNTALISRQAASGLGLRVDGELAIDTVQGPRRLKIIALMTPNNAVTEQLLSRLILTDIATAQELLGSFGRLNAIDVLLDPDRPDVAAKIRRSLPAGVLLVPVDSQSQAMREMTRAFSINLKAMGLLSLVVGMFLIYNTMTFLVLQRWRLIGSLRALGVTRRQIFTLIIGEASALAVVGILLGIVLGIALGQGLLILISSTLNDIYFRIESASLMITPWHLAKSALLGIVATLLAVLPPAFEATRISPAAVLVRSQLESDVRRMIKIATWMSGVFLACGIGLAWASGKSIGLGLASIFLLLFGFALLTPLLTLASMKLIERIVSRFSGILVRLPVRMVSAEISRAGIAIAALMIAVAATIGMDLMIDSFRRTVADWLQTTLQADLYIALPGEKRPGAGAKADHRLKAGIAGLENVRRLSSVLHTQVIAEGRLTRVSVYEANEKSRKGFIFKHPIDDKLWDRFEREQTLLVTEPYAYHHGVKVGGKILLQTDRGDRWFEVIGIYADYSGDQGHLAMSRENYRPYWADLGYSGIGIYAEDGANLKNLENQLNLLITGQQSVKSERAIYKASMELFEKTFTVTDTLRWLSAVIAFVGVFSALMAIQFERTRELGVLRALGMTPGQLTALITAETGLMGLAAGLIAIPVGYIVAYLLIFVIYRRSFGWSLAFHVHSDAICQGLVLAVAAAVLAGLIPALKMARTKPVEALRTE
jgi:putative ABC transport system permease protein